MNDFVMQGHVNRVRFAKQVTPVSALSLGQRKTFVAAHYLKQNSQKITFSALL